MSDGQGAQSKYSTEGSKRLAQVAAMTEGR